MACDLVVAAEGTKLGEPEIRYGSAPVTLLMPYLIGQKKTRELLLTGDLIDAVEAERIGLINRVVPAGAPGRRGRRPGRPPGPHPARGHGPDQADAQPGDGRGGLPAGGRGRHRPRRDHQRRRHARSSASGTRSSGATASRRPSPGATGATTSGSVGAPIPRRRESGGGPLGTAPSSQPQVSLASAQSAWSKSTLSPPLVTTSWRAVLPVTLALTVAVGLAPVRTPESYTLVPSAKTWKTTEPLLATSSSSADLGRERRAAAHRVADVASRRGCPGPSGRRPRPGSAAGRRRPAARRCCDPSRPVPSRWRSRCTAGPTGRRSCRRRPPS